MFETQDWAKLKDNFNNSLQNARNIVSVFNKLPELNCKLSEYASDIYGGVNHIKKPKSRKKNKMQKKTKQKQRR